MHTVARSSASQACTCAVGLPAIRAPTIQLPLRCRPAAGAGARTPWAPRRGHPTQLLEPHGAISTSQTNGMPSATTSAVPVGVPEGPAQTSNQGSNPPSQPQPTSANASSSSSSNQTATPTMEPISSNGTGFQLRPIHMLMFSLIFVGGALFATMTLQFTAGMEFTTAVTTVLRRVARSVAFRQLVVIACAVLLLRYGLNNFMMALSKFSSSPVQWDKTKLFYILREVYQPLELLLFIAAVCTVADAYAPALIGVPRSTVSHVMKSILSTSFILGFASVVFNLKSRFCKENAWQAEMKGDVTTQRRWEAYDKLGTFVIYVMSFVLGVQALGLEGIGGLAIGLAGREICENLLNGFLIMSTNPFEVGDEITFFHNNKVVEGFVIDIGWYRTNVRSFEREVYVIPNAVFSKNIVLNVSRKNREWRFYETLCLRVQDVPKANAIVQDIRRIMRNDTRVINKLHRRVFLDKITTDDARIYMSFYLEAANRDAFMAIKQDLLVSFVDCVERNGAKLATPRTVVDMDPEVADVINNVAPMLQGLSAYAMAQNLQQQQQAAQAPPPNQLALPATITAEATTVSTSTASTSAVQGGGVVQGGGGVQSAATASTDKLPSSIPGGAPSSSGAGSPQSGGGAGSGNGKSTGPGLGSASPAPASLPTSSAPAEKKVVGEVFTAPQSTVVVSVPASGVPVAFAGSVSNNVVASGALTTPPGGSSSGRGSPSSSVPVNGAGANGSGGANQPANGEPSAGNQATPTNQPGVLPHPLASSSPPQPGAALHPSSGDLLPRDAQLPSSSSLSTPAASTAAPANQPPGVGNKSASKQAALSADSAAAAPSTAGAGLPAGSSPATGSDSKAPQLSKLKEMQTYLQQGLAAAVDKTGRPRPQKLPPASDLVTASQVITPAAAGKTQPKGMQQAGQLQQQQGAYSGQQTATDVIMASFDDLPG